MMEATGRFLQKIIKSLPKLWSIMMNQEAELFTLNASIRIYQIINLKTVAIQAVSHQVRKNRVLLSLMLNMYGKLFWTRRVVTPVAALFLLFVVSIPTITIFYHLLGFYYQTSLDEDGKLLSLTINESIEDYRYEKMACRFRDSCLSVLTFGCLWEQE